MMDVFGFISINLVVWLTAFYFACWFLKKERISLILLASFLLYFSQITISLLILGVIVGELNPRNLYLLHFAMAMLVTTLIIRHGLSPIRQIARGFPFIYGQSDWAARLLLILFVLAFLFLLVKIWYLPPHVWDVFMYHLTPAVEWFQQGKIVRELPHVQPQISDQALGMTLLNLWYFIFLGQDTLMGLPQVLFSGLLVLTAYAFLRETTQDISLSVKFSVVVFFIPFVLMQADSAKDHIALSVSFFAGVFFLWKLLERRCISCLFLAGVSFGLMTGFKMGAIVQVPIALGLFLIYWFWGKDNHIQKGPFFATRMTITGAFSLAAIVALGGYWYFHGAIEKPNDPAVVQTDNIIHQGQQASCGSDGLLDAFKAYALSPALDSQVQRFRESLSLNTLKNNSLELVPRVFDYQNDYNTDLIGISGYGPQFAAFGIPVFIYLLISLAWRRLLFDSALLITHAALAAFLFYFLTYYNINSYRLLSFLAFMLIPSAGYLIFKYRLHTSIMMNLPVNLVIIFCVLWSFILTTLPHYHTNLRLLREFVSLPMDLRTSGRYTAHYQETPNLYWLIEHIPSEEPIAYLSSRKQIDALGSWRETWTYPLYDPQWRRKIHYLDQEHYLECKGDVCESRPALRDLLIKMEISLIATCRTSWCFSVRDDQFIELARGLYYYKGKT